MSITPPSNIPISVDYTSKDYYSLRAELIARVQDRIPEWTASDPADFGVALIEAFAYLGDMVSYYIDRASNESFITTATQRRSVLNIAQSYGYIPAGYRQAYTTLTFSNTSATDITLPEGTVVSGEVVIGDSVQTVYFTTDAEVIIQQKIGENISTEVVGASEGRSVSLVDPGNSNEYGELIGTSVGDASMSFQLGASPVVDDTIELYVQDGDTYSKWTQVQHILDSSALSQVFEVTNDEDDIVYVTFGDGVSGAIPIRYSEIRAKYTVGGGSLGNVSVGTLDTISYVSGLSENQLTALQSSITVTNEGNALGGSDPESLNQIRISAPLSLRANNRAVTLQDYADLALGVGNVGKASATAEIWTSVTVYIAPSRTATDTDNAPGLDDLGTPTLEYELLKTDVEDQLADKIMLGTTVTIQPPTYVNAIITITYTKLTQYTTTELETSIKGALLTSFGYTGMNFQDTIYPQDIEFILQQVNGVKTVRVTVLHREGESGLGNLVGQPNEIFRFLEENISIGPI
jgi:hypothetical protein